MNMTLAGIGVVILAVIAGLWAWTRRARKAGEDSVRAEIAVDGAEISQKQADAQANAPRSKDAIIDRLRNGGGL
jgi:hypothetical protein